MMRTAKMVRSGAKPADRSAHGLGRGARREPRRGAAAVEFAVVVPLMLLLLFGLIEYGRYMMVAQTSINASREGARMAAQGDFTVTQIRNEIREQIQNMYGDLAGDFDINVTSNGSTISGGDIDSQVPRGEPVEVEVVVDYSDVTLFPGGSFVFSNGMQIRGSTTMRRE